jgi:hypothetical protein
VRRRTAALIVAAGTLGAVAVGSGITAWANWSVELTNGRGSLKAAALPAMDRPEAGEDGSAPRVAWAAVEFASGHPVGGYVVIRHSENAQAEACRVPASTLACSDFGAKPGKVTYTVRAIAGTRWAGPASPASAQVQVTGKPVANNLVKESSSVATGSEDKASGTSTEQEAKGDAGGAERPATPSRTPAPGPSSSGPATGTGPEATEVAPARTVTSGEESGSGTSG